MSKLILAYKNGRYSFYLKKLLFKQKIIPSFKGFSDKIVWSGDFKSNEDALDAFFASTKIYHNAVVCNLNDTTNGELTVKRYEFFYFKSKEEYSKRHRIHRVAEIKLTNRQVAKISSIYSRSRIFQNFPEKENYCLRRLKPVVQSIYSELLENLNFN